MTEIPVANDNTRALEPLPSSKFENDCIDLLCKQENTMSMLSTADCFDSLDLAKEMIIQFLDFAEAHFTKEQLRDIGGRLQDVYQQTKDHEKRLCGRTFNPLKRLIRMEVFTEEQARASHEDLRSKYVELYRDFFAVCVERLGPESGNMEEFLQSVEMFVSELERKW